MTALTDQDRAAIAASVRRTASHAITPLTPEQLQDAINLAVDLYATAALHGLPRADVDSVTSFTNAAVDGIRARDRSRPSVAGGTVTA